MFVTCTVGAFFMPLKIRGSTANQARNKGGMFVKSTPELDKENVNPQRHRPRNSVPLSVRKLGPLRDVTSDVSTPSLRTRTKRTLFQTPDIAAMEPGATSMDTLMSAALTVSDHYVSKKLSL